MACRLFNRTLLEYSNFLHFVRTNSSYVPQHDPYDVKDLSHLQTFIGNSERIFVLTGAGVSTESGIPDYRSKDVGLYATTSRRPIQYRDFVSSSSARQKYWARSFVGWRKFSSFEPNITHKTLSEWQRRGKKLCIATQNVDGLHQKAGSRGVVELHGSIYDVVCLTCHTMISRDDFQTVMMRNNQYLPDDDRWILRPDGDTELSESEVKKFTVPSCEKCNGILKPNVVFFGDNVPKERVEGLKKELRNCDSLLAIGTSLSVFSAYRFIALARDENIPIALINIGETRADKNAVLKVTGRSGEILPLIDVY